MSRAITLRASVPSWHVTRRPLPSLANNIIQARISYEQGGYQLQVKPYDEMRGSHSSFDDTILLLC